MRITLVRDDGKVNTMRTLRIEQLVEQMKVETKMQPVSKMREVLPFMLPGDKNDYVQKVREYAKSCEAEVFVVCAQIEQEIAELDDDEKAMFLEDLGLKESGLEKLIKASYSLLGLISYLTAGPIESKAWTITRGTKAPQAAGKIHSDFERGFIKADVISYEDLIANGSMTAARDKGLVRSEGKEYVMQDGDVVLFKFNV